MMHNATGVSCQPASRSASATRQLREALAHNSPASCWPPTADLKVRVARGLLDSCMLLNEPQREAAMAAERSPSPLSRNAQWQQGPLVGWLLGRQGRASHMVVCLAGAQPPAWRSGVSQRSGRANARGNANICHAARCMMQFSAAQDGCAPECCSLGGGGPGSSRSAAAAAGLVANANPVPISSDFCLKPKSAWFA